MGFNKNDEYKSCAATTFKIHALVLILLNIQITGAGHGIGRELAIQLSSMGCIIICWDNDVESNRSTMREVSKNGGEVNK